MRIRIYASLPDKFTISVRHYHAQKTEDGTAL